MKETAFIFTSYDDDKKKMVPRMIVLFADNRFMATGDPRKFASQEAKQLMSRYGQFRGKELSSLLDEFIDAYADVASGYGSRVEMVEYSGSNKKRVDTISTGFDDTNLAKK